MSAPHVTSTGRWIGGVWTYALWRDEWLAAWGWIGAMAQIDIFMFAILEELNRHSEVLAAHIAVLEPEVKGLLAKRKRKGVGK